MKMSGTFGQFRDRRPERVARSHDSSAISAAQAALSSAQSSLASANGQRSGLLQALNDAAVGPGESHTAASRAAFNAARDAWHAHLSSVSAARDQVTAAQAALSAATATHAAPVVPPVTTPPSGTTPSGTTPSDANSERDRLRQALSDATVGPGESHTAESRAAFNAARDAWHAHLATNNYQGGYVWDPDTGTYVDPNAPTTTTPPSGTPPATTPSGTTPSGTTPSGTTPSDANSERDRLRQALSDATVGPGESHTAESRAAFNAARDAWHAHLATNNYQGGYVWDPDTGTYVDPTTPAEATSERDRLRQALSDAALPQGEVHTAASRAAFNAARDAWHAYLATRNYQAGYVWDPDTGTYVDPNASSVDPNAPPVVPVEEEDASVTLDRIIQIVESSDVEQTGTILQDAVDDAVESNNVELLELLAEHYEHVVHDFRVGPDDVYRGSLGDYLKQYVLTTQRYHAAWNANQLAITNALRTLHDPSATVEERATAAAFLASVSERYRDKGLNFDHDNDPNTEQVDVGQHLSNILVRKTTLDAINDIVADDSIGGSDALQAIADSPEAAEHTVIVTVKDENGEDVQQEITIAEYVTKYVIPGKDAGLSKDEIEAAIVGRTYGSMSISEAQIKLDKAQADLSSAQADADVIASQGAELRQALQDATVGPGESHTAASRAAFNVARDAWHAHLAAVSAANDRIAAAQAALDEVVQDIKDAAPPTDAEIQKTLQDMLEQEGSRPPTNPEYAAWLERQGASQYFDADGNPIDAPTDPDELQAQLDDGTIQANPDWVEPGDRPSQYLDAEGNPIPRTYEQILERFLTNRDLLNQASEAYGTASEAFHTDMDAYEAAVEAWNENPGGAAQLSELREWRIRLEERSKLLNDASKSINDMAEAHRANYGHINEIQSERQSATNAAMGTINDVLNGKPTEDPPSGQEWVQSDSGYWYTMPIAGSAPLVGPTVGSSRPDQPDTDPPDGYIWSYAKDNNRWVLAPNDFDGSGEYSPENPAPMPDASPPIGQEWVVTSNGIYWYTKPIPPGEDGYRPSAPNTAPPDGYVWDWYAAGDTWRLAPEDYDAERVPVNIPDLEALANNPSVANATITVYATDEDGKRVPSVGADGNPILNDDGDPVYETKTITMAEYIRDIVIPQQQERAAIGVVNSDVGDIMAEADDSDVADLQAIMNDPARAGLAYHCLRHRRRWQTGSIRGCRWESNT